jgi:hypothetical protein
VQLPLTCVENKYDNLSTYILLNKKKIVIMTPKLVTVMTPLSFWSYQLSLSSYLKYYHFQNFLYGHHLQLKAIFSLNFCSSTGFLPCVFESVETLTKMLNLAYTECKSFMTKAKKIVVILLNKCHK